MDDIKKSFDLSKERMDIVVYPKASTKGRRACKTNKSSKAQAKLNRRNSLDKLTRKVERDFGNGSLFVTLTYNEGNCPVDVDEAREDFRKLARRIRYFAKKKGTVLKYIYVVSGDSSARIHIHVLINGVSADVIREKWMKGHVNVRKMGQAGGDGITDCVRVARYLFKHRNGFRAWSTSKNLQPDFFEVEEASQGIVNNIKSFIKYKDKECIRRAFPGWDVLEPPYFYQGENGFYYIYLRLYRLGP